MRSPGAVAWSFTFPCPLNAVGFPSLSLVWMVTKTGFINGLRSDYRLGFRFRRMVDCWPCSQSASGEPSPSSSSRSTRHWLKYSNLDTARFPDAARPEAFSVSPVSDRCAGKEQSLGMSVGYARALDTLFPPSTILVAAEANVDALISNMIVWNPCHVFLAYEGTERSKICRKAEEHSPLNRYLRALILACVRMPVSSTL